MGSFTFNRSNKNKEHEDRIIARLRTDHWDYLDHIANLHNDYSLSSILKILLDHVSDLMCVGIDLYDPEVVRKLIKGKSDLDGAT